MTDETADQNPGARTEKQVVMSERCGIWQLAVDGAGGGHQRSQFVAVGFYLTATRRRARAAERALQRGRTRMCGGGRIEGAVGGERVSLTMRSLRCRSCASWCPVAELSKSNTWCSRLDLSGRFMRAGGVEEPARSIAAPGSLESSGCSVRRTVFKAAASAYEGTPVGTVPWSNWRGVAVWVRKEKKNKANGRSRRVTQRTWF